MLREDLHFFYSRFWCKYSINKVYFNFFIKQFYIRLLDLDEELGVSTIPRFDRTLNRRNRCLRIPLPRSVSVSRSSPITAGSDVAGILCVFARVVSSRAAPVSKRTIARLARRRRR